MRDLLLLLLTNLVCVAWAAVVYPMMIFRHLRTNRRLRGWLRIVCPLTIVALALHAILAPPHWWWSWVITAGSPVSWWMAHRMFCQDDHYRRWLEKARGLVQRRGNRLVVAES